MKEYIPVISALLGVFIGAMVSIYIAQLQFRENVISKYRQEWIQQIGNHIAEYEAVTLRVHMMIVNGTKEDRKDIRDLLQKMSFSSNRIALMLNLKDHSQNELHNMMIKINNELEKSNLPGNKDVVPNLLNKMNDVVRNIFAIEHSKAIEGE